MGKTEMPKELQRAIEVIKAYCEDHNDCQSCQFNGYCGTEPYYWVEE